MFEHATPEPPTPMPPTPLQPAAIMPQASPQGTGGPQANPFFPPQGTGGPQGNNVQNLPPGAPEQRILEEQQRLRGGGGEPIGQTPSEAEYEQQFGNINADK